MGPFERGPINLLFDSHTNADFPANCTVSNVNVHAVVGILNSFWIDDAQIAAYLNATFGLPILTTKFSETDKPNDVPMESHTWSWGLDGGKTSTITVYHDGTAGPIPASSDRLFWPRGSGIEALDIQYDRLGPSVAGNRIATGTFASPMLFASMPDGAYAGPGAWYAQVKQGDGRFTQYSDPDCLHPI